MADVVDADTRKQQGNALFKLRDPTAAIEQPLAAGEELARGHVNYEAAEAHTPELARCPVHNHVGGLALQHLPAARPTALTTMQLLGHDTGE